MNQPEALLRFGVSRRILVGLVRQYKKIDQVLSVAMP